MKSLTRLRIVHVFEPPDGGVPAYVHSIADHQRNSGHEVHTIMMGETTTGPRAIRMARTLRASALEINAIAPDIVHAHSSFAGLLRASNIHAPLLYQPHAWAAFRTRVRPIYNAHIAYERSLVKRTSAILALSEREVAVALSVGHKHVVRIPQILPDGASTCAGNRLRPQALSSQHVSNDTHRGDYIVVGRVCRQKGQLDLAHSFLRRQRSDETLHFYGDGPDITQLTRLAAESARMWVHGATVEPFESICGAGTLLIPSRWEGLPLVALEALSAGLPVAAFEATSVRELGLPPSIVGVVDDGNYEELWKVARRLERPSQVLPTPHFWREHSVAIVAEQITDYYRAVLTRVAP